MPLNIEPKCVDKKRCFSGSPEFFIDIHRKECHILQHSDIYHNLLWLFMLKLYCCHSQFKRQHSSFIPYAWCTTFICIFYCLLAYRRKDGTVRSVWEILQELAQCAQPSVPHASGKAGTVSVLLQQVWSGNTQPDEPPVY